MAQGKPHGLTSGPGGRLRLRLLTSPGVPGLHLSTYGILCSHDKGKRNDTSDQQQNRNTIYSRRTHNFPYMQKIQTLLLFTGKYIL
jgi:hypothetical protein